MAINTTGSNGSVVGVTGVHPDNIGNTLIFKDKVYNVNVGDSLTVGKNGLVDVKLSPDEGNLLEVRKNGVGYWATISEHKNTFYIDAVNGSDSNSGSREAPLRTINKACELISLENKPGDCWIYLKSQQNHVLNSKPVPLIQNTVSLATYGEPTYDLGDKVHNGNISALYPDFKVANVIIEQSNNENGTSASSLHVLNLFAYGVSFYQKFGVGTQPYGTYHVVITPSGGSVNLWGSDIYQQSNGVAIRSSQIATVCSNYFNDSAEGKFTEVTTSPSLFVYEHDYLRSSNIRTTSKSKFISATQYDINTKRLFGFSTSWDFFNNPD